MALRITGGLVVRALKPNFVKTCLAVPGSLNLQVRNAARKGYRAAAQRKKKAQKLEKVVIKEEDYRKKGPKLEATVPTGKPSLPDDDIIILDNFDYKRYSMLEAVNFHKEYHHPTVYNNPEAFVTIRMEFNLTGKKETQVIKPFSGVAQIPHPFSNKRKREVLVICVPEDVEGALSAGASVAGGADVVQKIQAGVLHPSFYDYLICHTEMMQVLTPIRGLLKDKLPRTKIGTLTNNVKRAVNRFLHGIDYQCLLMDSQRNSGVIVCHVGTIDMPSDHLEANFKSLLQDVQQFKPPREGEFVKWVWCLSHPSNEQFCIDHERYLKELEKGKDGDEVREEKLTVPQEEPATVQLKE